MWLKGRVYKEGDISRLMRLDQWEIKLKEIEDKIKEGTLQVDQGTDAMTLVLGKEKGRLCKRSGKWSDIQEVCQQESTDRGNGGLN
ncbi:hypothetical protein Tco_0968486 [Tanacetum coccineum]